MRLFKFRKSGKSADKEKSTDDLGTTNNHCPTVNAEELTKRGEGDNKCRICIDLG